MWLSEIGLSLFLGGQILPQVFLLTPRLLPPVDRNISSRKRAYGTIRLQHVDKLDNSLFGQGCVQSERPLSFEQLKHPLGYVMYYSVGPIVEYL